MNSILIAGSVGAWQQAAARAKEKGDRQKQNGVDGKTFNHAAKLNTILLFSSQIHHSVRV
jgi:hypothetical protein